MSYGVQDLWATQEEKLSRPDGRCLRAQIHTILLLVVKALLQLHFVLMMTSCFVSIHLTQQTVLRHNSPTIKLHKRSQSCTTASYIFFQVVSSYTFRFHTTSYLFRARANVISSKASVVFKAAGTRPSSSCSPISATYRKRSAGNSNKMK